MLTIVGVGPGGCGQLTVDAQQALAGAQILVGGARHLALFGSFCGIRRKIDSDIDGLCHWLDEVKQQNVVILASGDPSLYGIAKRLISQFGLQQVRVVPGISAVQYLCARAGVDMNDLYLTSSHGRLADFDWIAQHHKVAMVTDVRCGPREIAAALCARGWQGTMVIGENLGQENEQIYRLPLSAVAGDYQMNVVVVFNER
jgi:cobalt-precorrin-7 (C5)-methyltransferase